MSRREIEDDEAASSTADDELEISADDELSAELDETCAESCAVESVAVESPSVESVTEESGEVVGKASRESAAAGLIADEELSASEEELGSAEESVVSLEEELTAELEDETAADEIMPEDSAASELDEIALEEIALETGTAELEETKLEEIATSDEELSTSAFDSSSNSANRSRTWAKAPEDKKNRERVTTKNRMGEIYKIRCL